MCYKSAILVLLTALLTAACQRDPGRPLSQPFSLGTPACKGGDVCRGDH